MYEDYTHYVANGHLLKPGAARSYSRIFCNGAGVVVAPSVKAKDSLISYGVTRPINVIPTGFDFTQFMEDNPKETARIKKSLGVPQGAKVMVSVCRIAKEKSIDIIISQMPELLKKLPGLKFVIVGSGPYTDILKELCVSLNVADSVIFAGPKSWDEIAKYYKTGDLFVSASTSETQGLTLMEAMASGTPVAVIKDPSTESVVKNKQTGYTFEIETCADVLYTALTSDNTAIVKNARQGIGEFSAATFALKIEETYNEAALNKPQKWYKVKMPRVFTKAASFVVDARKSALSGLRFPKTKK
jgi:1,2-diacylglycerol 3-alpha-glucosyltransferase